MSEIGDRIKAADCAPPRDCCEGAKPVPKRYDSVVELVRDCLPEDPEFAVELEQQIADRQPETTKFATGAVRSADRAKQRYDLISPIGLRQLAETCHEGAEKYSDFNWEKGMPVHDLLNHAVAHIYAYLSGDRSEPHLAHGAWNLFAAMHSEELWPELNEGHLREAGCKPPMC